MISELARDRRSLGVISLSPFPFPNQDLIFPFMLAFWVFNTQNVRPPTPPSVRAAKFSPSKRAFSSSPGRLDVNITSVHSSKSTSYWAQYVKKGNWPTCQVPHTFWEHVTHFRGSPPPSQIGCASLSAVTEWNMLDLSQCATVRFHFPPHISLSKAKLTSKVTLNIDLELLQ